LSAHGGIANLSRRLIDNGYHPIPLRGKAPAIKSWNRNGVYSERWLEVWGKKFANANIGCLTGGLLAIDIDLDEPVTARNMAALAMEIIGHTDFIRIGREPKRALLYQAERPIRKRQVGKVEILGKGQQLAVWGIHPDTMAPYDWPIESIIDCPLDQLPKANYLTIQEFLSEASARQDSPQSEPGNVVERYEGRNSALFYQLKEAALRMDDFNELSEIAASINASFQPPLPGREVNDTLKQVWSYKQDGRLMAKGQQSTVLPFGKTKILELAPAPHAFFLYGYLRQFGTQQSFTIPQKVTANLFGWGKDRVRNAIRLLINTGLIEIDRVKTAPAGARKPIWYRYCARQ